MLYNFERQGIGYQLDVHLETLTNGLAFLERWKIVRYEINYKQEGERAAVGA